MRPAFSVLLLTTLIGAGQGLFLALFLVQICTLAGILPPQDGHRFYAHGSLLALVLLVAGLIASFFHLGRPERAWRAAAMWRTSWLSREVIVLPAFVALVLMYGVAHRAGAIDPSLALGIAGTVVAFALYVCTAMIYACLPFLREWASPLTIANFILLGGASGFTLAAVFAVFAAPELIRFFAGAAFVLTLLGGACRVASLIRNARLRPKSTLQTAIGIKHPRIVQRSMGFMGGSFNTREFFHGRPLSFVRSIKAIFLAAAFALPLLLLGAAWSGAPTALLPVAFVVQYLGLLAERWYFFAEANHPQNLYYQAIA
ncbi:MAG: DmsC/YnfH family molybdoenzyme membrane anchor subunit [Casimicrobiaceae bacterium]